jgi:hypothetical protein
MANEIADNLKNTFRYLPQRTIEGVLGQGIGQKVEGWLGMPLAPNANGEVYQPAGSPGLPSAWEKANQESIQQHLQQPPRRMMPQR